MITYPRELLFGVNAKDPIRVAVVAAAEEIGLPMTTTDATVRVTVDSPMTAYRFGMATRKYMNPGQAAPAPIAPPAEAVDEHP